MAVWRSSTSPWPGSPISTSSHFSFSGPPVSWKRMAWLRMASLQKWETGRLKRQKYALKSEEGLFGLDAGAPAIADEGAIGAHHPVAGNEDGDGIAPAGAADIAGIAADLGGDLAIGQGPAIGDLQHRIPDLAVEFASSRRQRQLEALQIAEEITVELGRGGEQHRRRLLRRLRLAPADRDDGAIPLPEGERSHRCIDAEFVNL